MFKKSLYLLIFLPAIVLQEAASQNSQTLYFMNVPQNHLLNPALKPSNSFYLSVPALTGINININNNFVNFSDVIMPNQKGDSLISFLHPDYNPDNFIKKLKANNFIAPQVNIQLLGLGFKAGKDMYISLDITERVEGNFALPKDLFILALKGNNDFLGKTINLSGLDARLQYYHEFGMGVSRNITNKLRIGIRGKLLFGVANMSLNNKSLGLTVNNDYSFDFNANLAANISGPVKVYSSANKIDSVVFDDKRLKEPSFYLNTKNMGLGVDIGAVYQLTDKICLSASITDLGYIKWKSDVTNLQTKSTFKFSGFNITDVANGTKTFDQLATEMVDSLKNSFKITNTTKGFNTFLPTGVYIGGSYNLTKSISLGILSYSLFSGKQIREALTLSANINLGSALSTSVSYTAENSRYDNIGAGLAFRLGIFQIYLMTDKIPLTWNKILTKKGSGAGAQSSSIMLPSNWNTVNFRFGVNIVMGNHLKKKNDKPMLSPTKH
jgi:hypothetical protein